LALNHVKLYGITFAKRLETRRLDRRVVDEAVLLAIVGGDEAEALLIVEPLHFASGA
jgi:hypothetical protein